MKGQSKAKKWLKPWGKASKQSGFVTGLDSDFSDFCWTKKIEYQIWKSITENNKTTEKTESKETQDSYIQLIFTSLK